MTVQKTVVVTGGAGFIGSRLCTRLVKAGYRVISLDNYFAGSRGNHVEGVEYREGHTKDIEKLIPETPDIIYHLGEYSRVEQSVLEPEKVHDLNVVGTRAVVAFWREKKSKLVYAGSSTKFGDDGQARTATPYAASKAANSELVKEVGERESLPYAITYFYNVYGKGERSGVYGTVIEAFKQMYLHGEPLSVTAPGTQERNFTHVDDIVDGLILVGEKGQGDEYGLGSEQVFSILEVARLFGREVVMLPPRSGNRMRSRLDAHKSRALGWQAKHTLASYVADFVQNHKPGERREKRVLIFSTTFFPVAGPAEQALYALMQSLPGVHFDIVTSSFTFQKQAHNLPNATLHHVGIGRPIDKYLLPILGYIKAGRLYKKHSYLFTWALMASYGALAGLFLKWSYRAPLLITLGDQNIENRSMLMRGLLQFILNSADQAYGLGTSMVRRSLGTGDAFANQLRYAYADILRSETPS